MEKLGIITGIGNEITPEIDAIINDYIVGKNAIIKGLEIENNTYVLSAGVCQLCGYGGVLENTETITGNFIYGKFVINFDKDIEDSFSIVTSEEAITQNENPTSIKSQGTYYLRLYERIYNPHTNTFNWVTELPTYKYPKQAYYASDLVENGVVSSTATTYFADNEVNVHETQPDRIASTKYVHNQIVEEFNEEEITIDVLNINNSKIGEMYLHRKARFVIGYVTINTSSTNRGMITKMPTGFYPKQEFYFAVRSKTSQDTTIAIYKCDTQGNITTEDGTNLVVMSSYNPITFGYEV